MTVLGAWPASTWNSVTGLTMNGLQDMEGKWLILVGVDRGGGQTVTLSGTDAALVTALGTPIVQRVTTPTNGTERRSVWMWIGLVPIGVSSNPIVAGDARDASDVEQTMSAIAFVCDIDDSYVLQGVASADSGGSTVTAQVTGETPTIPVGDQVIVAAACIRGDGTTVWTETDDEPANPGGGTWLLEASSGSGAGQRHAVAGVLELLAQPAQTWEDTLTLGTARMVSTVIAVLGTGTSGEAHSGGSTALINVLSSGGGTAGKAGGSTASVNVDSQGAGSPGFSNSSDAEVSISSEGAGSIQVSDGSEALVPILVDGEGSPAVEGGDEAFVAILASGAGQTSPAFSGGSEATVDISADAGGSPGLQGGSVAVMNVIAMSTEIQRVDISVQIGPTRAGGIVIGGTTSGTAVVSGTRQNRGE